MHLKVTTHTTNCFVIYFEAKKHTKSKVQG